MKPKLSATMQRAIDVARDHGDALIRKPGGYWTYPDCPCSTIRGFDVHEIPDWYVGTNTVYALIERGVVEITSRMRRGDACAVRLVK